VLIEIDDTTGQNETSEPVKVDSYPIFPVAIAIISGAIVGGAAVWLFAVASQTTQSQEIKRLQNDFSWEKKKNQELMQDKKDKCEIAKQFAQTICK
jgi:hypothetical protein